MTTLNILIAILGLTGTLSAFGGETWTKGDAPLLQRITKRGYLSVICLLMTFTLGIIKEVKTNQQKIISANENSKLNEKIKSLQDSLIVNTKSISQSSKEVQVKVDELKSSNCEGIEQAFKLAVNIPREYDDNVVDINGQSRIIVSGRITNPMEIYWGDNFEYSFFGDGFTGPASDLISIKLRVGDKDYDLQTGSGSIYYHGSVRIYGSNPKPMIASIINPANISGIKIKIFVRSTDATRGQQEFKKAVLSGQCSEYAKKIYKVVNCETIRLRSQADETASVRSTLTKGSFVRTLQIVGEWTEVLTPENRQGWIKSDFLSTIKE